MSGTSVIRSRWAAIGAAVAVALGAGGLYAVGAVDDAAVFVPVTPTRVLDTRLGVGLAGQFVSAQGRTFKVTGTIPIVVPVDTPSTGAPVPEGATAIVANVTAFRPTGRGFVSVRPGSSTGIPSTSSLNVLPGDVVPNSVTVPLAPDGTINLYYEGGTGATTHLLIDIVGYYRLGSPGPQGPAGPQGPGGMAGNSASYQRLVAITGGPAPTANTEAGSSIALGADRFPIVAFGDVTVGDLRIVQCLGTCEGNTMLTVDTGSPGTNIVGVTPSIAIGANGLPIIAHYDDTANNLRVTRCANVNCTSATTVALDSGQNSGFDPALTIGSDGFPIIAHNLNNADIRVTKCGDATCSTSLAIHTTIVTPTVDVSYPSIAIGTDGLAVISRQSSNGDLVVSHCSNVACTSATTITVDDIAAVVGAYSSVAIGIDGFPVIAHQVLSANDLRVTHCTTITCSSSVSTTVETAGNVGYYASLTIGVDGHPVIAHRDDSFGRLHVSRCNDVGCSSVTVYTPDPNLGGNNAAIAIDALSLPVISHIDHTGNLRVTAMVNTGWGP